MNKKQTRWHRGLWVVWAVMFVGFMTFLVVWYYRGQGDVNVKWAANDDRLKVYNAEGVTFTSWSRDDAIKFGLDSVANTIIYLWVAASALLGLIGRFMIDPLLDPKRGQVIRSITAFLLIKHSAIGALISICFGFYGYLHFANMVSDETYTIYGDLLAATFCQIFSFVVAAVLLMLAVNSIVTQHLKTGEQQL